MFLTLLWFAWTNLFFFFLTKKVRLKKNLIKKERKPDQIGDHSDWKFIRGSVDGIDPSLIDLSSCNGGMSFGSNENLSVLSNVIGNFSHIPN